MAGDAKPRKERAKSNQVQFNERVEIILQACLEGASRKDMLQIGTENEWNVNPRQIENYVKRAKELMVERTAGKRKQLLGQHLARREFLYTRRIKANDDRTALAVLDSSAKLLGFDAGRDYKELVKLAVEQGRELEQLKQELEEAKRAAQPPQVAPQDRPRDQERPGGPPEDVPADDPAEPAG